jgi:sulfate adenylyltransferase subunit 1 (EFTu-like GTPase family)
MDYSLFMDGLLAERERRITIDVAYRHMDWRDLHVIIADCPGHDQYLRNLVTGASTADIAIILIDAKQGITWQTRLHGYVARRIGIGGIIVAVNKMDLVDYDMARFSAIANHYVDYLLSIPSPTRREKALIVPVPTVATLGLGVMTPYPVEDAPSVLSALCRVISAVRRDACEPPCDEPLRLPIRCVSMNGTQRVYYGSV